MRNVDILNLHIATIKIYFEPIIFIYLQQTKSETPLPEQQLFASNVSIFSSAADQWYNNKIVGTLLTKLWTPTNATSVKLGKKLWVPVKMFLRSFVVNYFYKLHY